MEGGDTGFRIYSKKDEDLIPHCRVDSHLLMEELTSAREM
jgi:hypothetical protein